MDFPSDAPDALALQTFLDLAHLEDHLDHAATLPFDGDVSALANWNVDAGLIGRDQNGPTARLTGDRPTETLGPTTDTASDSSGGDSTAARAERRRKRPKSNPSSPKGTPAKPSSVDGDAKPRKPTYLVRKEEKSSLNDEIRLLEARLELLKVKAGLPTGEEKRTLSGVQSANFEIEETIHANLLGIARFHSLLSRYLHSIPVSPMNTFIHLSKDVAERRATLRAIREMKLRRAQELTESRMRYEDATKPYATEERYVTDDGVYHCKRFEILPFDGVRSAQQLFDAFMYYTSNVEIAVSDSTGHVTIREDMDMVEPTIWNHRLASAVDAEGTYVQELNTVGFSHYVEPPDRAPYAVVAMDAVDVDELYPYKPHARVRKDVTSAISITEVRRPGTHELVVVFRRCTFLALHPPQFAMPANVLDDLRAGIADWCHVMNKFLRTTMATAGS